ncbi:DinB family protein [Paenibacillus soyae]|uniref:DinB family protein n=1 Tax=Paenibacillus soyae TaxID=2969249 RepID=A0A9X2MSP9_9BACL|nr:DinB family protein [Paenibacillus soyae]
MLTNRPHQNDYNIFFDRYVKLLDNGDLIEIYNQQEKAVITMVERLSDSDADYRYGTEKWSIKEVLGHLCDAERMFNYWMFCIARNESNPIASIHIGRYVEQADFAKRPISEVLEEWASIRKSSLTLLKSLQPEDFQKKAMFRDYPTTVLAIACIIPGHVQHHIHVLQERYHVK